MPCPSFTVAFGHGGNQPEVSKTLRFTGLRGCSVVYRPAKFKLYLRAKLLELLQGQETLERSTCPPKAKLQSTTGWTHYGSRMDALGCGSVRNYCSSIDALGKRVWGSASSSSWKLPPTRCKISSINNTFDIAISRSSGRVLWEQLVAFSNHGLRSLPQSRAW